MGKSTKTNNSSLNVRISTRNMNLFLYIRLYHIHSITGTDNIPGPVSDLHATVVTNTSISLEWVPYQDPSNNTEMENIDYLVQYGKVNNMTMYETVVKLENVNISFNIFHIQHYCNFAYALDLLLENQKYSHYKLAGRVH